MRTIQVDDGDALGTAAAALRAGAVVVVPTDTVYGLAALPDLPEAVDRIYQAKGRPPGQHLPVLAGGMQQVRALGTEVPATADALATRWWPGPLTLVLGFAADGSRPPWLAGREEVAVRVPRHDFLLALMEETGVLLVTSANRHGSPTPATAAETAAALAPHVSLLVDGGARHGAPSTLVNVGAAGAAIERQGAIGADEIAATLDAVTGAA